MLLLYNDILQNDQETSSTGVYNRAGVRLCKSARRSARTTTKCQRSPERRARRANVHAQLQQPTLQYISPRPAYHRTTVPAFNPQRARRINRTTMPAFQPQHARRYQSPNAPSFHPCCTIAGGRVALPTPGRPPDGRASAPAPAPNYTRVVRRTSPRCSHLNLLLDLRAHILCDLRVSLLNLRTRYLCV